ncbi:hypothetical protein ACIQZI_01690 [Peribacillus sp. NPDC096379]|uniref:hypothetical protein n=1 Tax=Peribacillus sp. NPDC096379 TaxID=3364393 RepID=UPI00380B9B06
MKIDSSCFIEDNVFSSFRVWRRIVWCLPYNSWDKVKATPAQRLGIADKQFTMKDIIYFK